MLLEYGTVTKVDGDRVRVLGHRKVSCEGGDCGCGAMAGRRKEKEIEAFNRAGAREGDLVQLSLPETKMLWAATAVYLLPALLLVVGAITGYSLSPALGINVDLGSALGTLTGLGAGLTGTVLMSRNAERTARTLPVVTQVLLPGTKPPKCETPGCCC